MKLYEVSPILDNYTHISIPIAEIVVRLEEMTTNKHFPTGPLQFFDMGTLTENVVVGFVKQNEEASNEDHKWSQLQLKYNTSAAVLHSTIYTAVKGGFNIAESGVCSSGMFWCILYKV